MFFLLPDFPVFTGEHRKALQEIFSGESKISNMRGLGGFEGALLD